MIGPGWDGLALTALPLIGAMALLALAGLGQIRPMLIAATRMVGQLLLLGLVLRWIFERPSPWVVTAAALVMLSASAQTVGSRQRGGTGWFRAQALLAMAVAAVAVLAVAVRLGLGVEPWYRPEVVIPLLGMILGNSVNGLALAAERLESELRSSRDQVELRLALGASVAQAAQPALRAAVAAALTPTINGMSIAGLVAIPGMMTGQLLAGAQVEVALRYQMLIYLAIATTVTASTLILLRLRLGRYFTRASQLRLDRLGTAPR